MKKIYWLLGVVLLVLAGGGSWWWQQRDSNDGVQYRTGKIERGALSSAVSASGTVNPVSLVTVGTQVSGQIQDILVDFNSEVKAGQLLAQIDPETFEYRVRSAQADVDAARSAVLTAQANSAASRAAVSRAETDLTEAERTHLRNLSLVEKGFIAQSEADRTRALVTSSKEAVKAAQAQLGVTEAQIKSAQANVAQRDSALAQSRIDLARTRIHSPINGIIIKRTIEKGQTVAASLQAPELFIIAQNLSDMQVDASVDEADVGRIRSGQKASFTVDAFPGQTFEGEVRQVRKAAQNVANVVTYIAVVRFNNTSGRLLPGMTANVRVVTDQRESALKIPNAALRVRIAGVEPAADTPKDAPKKGAEAQSSERATAQNSSNSSNPATEFRNRLVAELQLTPPQIEKVDAIYAEARPKFMTLRDLPAEERTKARERITGDIRARIAELLTPEQKPKYATMVAEAGSRQSTRGRIYLQGEDGKPRAYSVRLGISDGTSTELLVGPNSPDAGVLKEGGVVITGVIGGPPTAPKPPAGGGPRPIF